MPRLADIAYVLGGMRFEPPGAAGSSRTVSAVGAAGVFPFRIGREVRSRVPLRRDETSLLETLATSPKIVLPMRQPGGDLVGAIDTRGRVPDTSVCAIVPSASPVPPEYMLAVLWSSERRPEAWEIDLTALRGIAIPIPKPSDVDAVRRLVTSLSDAYAQGAVTTIKWLEETLRRRVAQLAAL